MAPPPHVAWISAVSLAPVTTWIHPASTSVAATRYVRSQHSTPASSHSRSIWRMDCSIAASWRKSSRVLYITRTGASSVAASTARTPNSASSKTSNNGAALDESTRHASARIRPARRPGTHGRSMPAGSSPLRASDLRRCRAKAVRACLSSISDNVAVSSRSVLSRTTCFASSPRATAPQLPTYAASTAPCDAMTAPPLVISQRKFQNSVMPTYVGLSSARFTKNFVSASAGPDVFSPWTSWGK
mmetsp:Transcript_4860/g.14721  ORF Transcript_4860/g.14721 Transcript_4860/m.14721 type:complete len:244 (+) Transcript_4860:322-1053(+)